MRGTDRKSEVLVANREEIMPWDLWIETRKI
jgi:hypothetical protein